MTKQEQAQDIQGKLAKLGFLGDVVVRQGVTKDAGPGLRYSSLEEAAGWSQEQRESGIFAIQIPNTDPDDSEQKMIDVVETAKIFAKGLTILEFGRIAADFGFKGNFAELLVSKFSVEIEAALNSLVKG